MSAKHTPGPWSHLPIQGECRISNEDFLLMRAAPDLLQELQNIADATPSTWGAESDQFQAWAQNRARAAIAKATGEAS